MASTVVDLWGPLPPVCACCGKPAAHAEEHQFVHTGTWNIPLALLGTWFFTRLQMPLPLCAQHRYTVRFAWAWPFAGLVVGGLSLFIGYAVYSVNFGREASDAAAGWVRVAAGVGFLAFALALFLRKWSLPHVARIEADRWVTLARVAPEFAAAVAGRSLAPGYVRAEEIVEAQLADEGSGK